MKPLRLVILLLLSQEAALAQGQYMNPDMCGRLFSAGLAKFDILSDTTRYDTFHENYCSAHFESYASFQNSSGGFGISVPLAKGILGLTGSEESNSSNFKTINDQFCHDTQKQSYFRERFSSSSTQVTSELNASFAKCMETYSETWLKGHGVLLTVEPYPDLSRLRATVYVNNQGGFAAGPTINAISPHGLKCMLDNQIVNPGVTKLKQAQSLLDCEKDPNQSMNMALEIENFPVSNSVSVPGYAPTLKELDDQVRVLQQQIVGLQKKLDDAGGKPNLITTAEGDGCEILGDRQLCWGSTVLAFSGKGETRHKFTFQKPFRQGAAPTVTTTISNESPGANSAGYALLGVIGYSESSKEFDMATFHNFSEDLPAGTVSVSYIAIGFSEK